MKKTIWIPLIVMIISVVAVSAAEDPDPLVSSLWNVWTFDTLTADNRSPEHFTGINGTYDGNGNPVANKLIPGKINNALNFTANELTHFAIPSQFTPTGDNDKCIAFWGRMNNFEEAENAFLSMGTAVSNQELSFFENGTNEIHIERNGGSQNTGISPSLDFSLYMLSYSAINDTIQFFANTSQVISYTQFLNTGSNDIILGVRRNFANWQGNVAVDDLRIYNTTCGQEQLDYLYNGGAGRDITDVAPANNAPVVNITFPADNATVDDDEIATWSVVELENTYEQNVTLTNGSGIVHDSGTLAQGVNGSTVPFGDFANGTYTLTVSVIETNGTDFFVGTDSHTINIAIEGVPPAPDTCPAGQITVEQSRQIGADLIEVGILTIIFSALAGLVFKRRDS